MYQTTLISLNPPVGSNGEVLEFIGDFSPSVGETVWTDGRVIFGHVPRYNVPIITSQKGGVPIASTSKDRKGYYNKNGDFKSFDVDSIKYIVNDNKTFYTVSGQNILDATVYEGSLYVAKRVGDNIQIYKDCGTENETIYQEIVPDEQGVFSSFDKLIFADDLNYTAWGHYTDYGTKTAKEEEYVYEVRSGGYECYYTDYHGTDYATAYFRFFPPTIIRKTAMIRETHNKAYSYILKSDGTKHIYSGSNRVSQSGWKVDGEYNTEPITSGIHNDIGDKSQYWEGTCTCTSHYYAFGSFMWFGNEPLENMNIVNHVSTQHTVSADKVISNESLGSYPYTYDLQNGFHGVVSSNKSAIVNHTYRELAHFNTPYSFFRGAYSFNDNYNLFLSDDFYLSKKESDILTNIGDCKNYKLNYLKNIKKALTKK